MKLKVTNHDRDIAGLRYVYPVVSRRARGVSIGVNLNPNNACNYRCIYCQVPELTFGKGPPIALEQLEQELRGLLDDVIHGDFMERQVPEGSRRLNDIALSGNGEPTSSPQFADTIELIERLLSEYALLGSIKVVLITNGTLADKPQVEQGIERMARLNGEVWFKFDSATDAGTAVINSNTGSMAARLERLRRVSTLCPTWLQTCLFALDGEAPSEAEQAAYLGLIAQLKAEAVPVKGVLLYGLARPSLQPEAPRLTRLSEAWLQSFGQKIAELGMAVTVTP